MHNVAKPTSFPLLLLHYCKQVIAVEDVTACAVGVCVSLLLVLCLGSTSGQSEDFVPKRSSRYLTLTGISKHEVCVVWVAVSV